MLRLRTERRQLRWLREPPLGGILKCLLVGDPEHANMGYASHRAWEHGNEGERCLGYLLPQKPRPGEVADNEWING